MPAVETTSRVAISFERDRTVQSTLERPELKLTRPALNTRRLAGEIEGAGSTHATAWLRPAFLAAYIARSAQFSMSSNRCPGDKDDAPKLHETATDPPGKPIGFAAMARRAFSSAAIPSERLVCGSKRANSSPPIRPMTSDPRIEFAQVSTMPFNTRTPAAWP